MKIQFKRLFDDAKAPERAHNIDAGADLFAHSVTIDAFGNLSIGTGVAVDIPPCHVGLLFARSSISKKQLLVSNSVGVIDAGYIGEITIKYKPSSGFVGFLGRFISAISGNFNTYKVGDKCAQLVIVPIPFIELDEVQTLKGGGRGAGGFGSTDKPIYR